MKCGKLMKCGNFCKQDLWYKAVNYLEMNKDVCTLYALYSYQLTRPNVDKYPKFDARPWQT